MRRTFGVLVILLATAGTVVGASFIHGPYSGAPTASSVTISWLSSEVCPARLEYGPTENYRGTQVFASQLDIPISEGDKPEIMHIALESLEPNTAYVYHIILITPEGNIESPLGHFVTEPPSGDAVQFAVLADTQWQWEGENRLAAVGHAIATDPMAFDFILHAGDLVETPGSTIWDHWFDSFGTMLLRAPFLPVLGNHEAGNRSYYDNFVLPPGDGKKDKRWWAFHWGDVVIVGLDTDVTKASDYIAQQDWARLHLSGPELHKIVMFHYPVYSSDAYHGSGYSLDVIYHPIFVETGVDMVINGHAHNYERIEVDGITYLVVGGGGAVPRALAEEHVPGSVIAQEGYNFYLRVAATPETMRVVVVSVAQATEETFELTDGDLLDAFVIPTHIAEAPEEARPNLILVLIALLGAAAALLLLRGMSR